jgi:cytochrome P450
MGKEVDMPSIDAAPQSDALAAELLTRPELSERAWRAVQGARQLEREVMRLGVALAASSGAGARTPAAQEELVRLLSKVVLFRVALAATTERGVVRGTSVPGA